MIDITVNGNRRELRDDATIESLVATLGLAGKRIAVERNGEIVPRSLHAQTRIEQGDRFDIVGAVGGG